MRDQYVPYLRRQENGNKCDTRWAAVTDLRGQGLLAVGLPLLDVSVHRYTPEDLASTSHAHELIGRDKVIPHLDHAQAPLGNSSCGPAPREQYLLNAEETTFSVALRPIDLADTSPMRLARELAWEAGRDRGD